MKNKGSIRYYKWCSSDKENGIKQLYRYTISDTNVRYKIIFKKPIPILKRTSIRTRKQIGLCYEYEFDGEYRRFNGKVIKTLFDVFLESPSVPTNYRSDNPGDYGTHYTYDTSNIKFIQVYKKVTSSSQNILW